MCDPHERRKRRGCGLSRHEGHAAGGIIDSNLEHGAVAAEGGKGDGVSLAGHNWTTERGGEIEGVAEEKITRDPEPDADR